MNRSYVALFAVALVLALALSVLGSRKHAPAAHTAAAAPAPEVALAIEVGPHGVEPERASVPKDHRVRLTIARRAGAPVSVRLVGYQDRVALDSLAAGETRVIEFLADRPGGDFTWLIDGKPSGWFAVTGSHLVEDHR